MIKNFQEAEEYLSLHTPLGWRSVGIQLPFLEQLLDLAEIALGSAAEPIGPKFSDPTVGVETIPGPDGAPNYQQALHRAPSWVELTESDWGPF